MAQLGKKLLVSFQNCCAASKMISFVYKGIVVKQFRVYTAIAKNIGDGLHQNNPLVIIERHILQFRQSGDSIISSNYKS